MATAVRSDPSMMDGYASQAASLTFRQWLRTTGPLRRAYPVALGLRYAHLRTERCWAQSAEAREGARRQMRFLLGRSGWTGDWDALAKSFMLETFKREELAWRPAVTSRYPMSGVERVRRLLDARRGVIINFMHHGLAATPNVALKDYAGSLIVPAHPTVMDAGGESIESRLRRQQRRTSRRHNSTPLRATGSFEHLLSRLSDGGMIALASDLPGRTQVRFLGQEVGTASGAARLALATGAAIVPLTAHRDGELQRLRLETPIEPGDFSDHIALQQAIFDRHEAAVCSWPEAVSRPRSRFRQYS